MLSANACLLVEENMEWARRIALAVARQVGARSWTDDLVASAFEGLCIKAAEWETAPVEDVRDNDTFRSFAHARVSGKAFDTFRTLTHRGHLVLEPMPEGNTYIGRHEFFMMWRFEAPENDEDLFDELRVDADRYLHSDQERQAIMLTLAGVPLKEIGRMWGLTESRACQVLKKAERVLRAARIEAERENEVRCS